MRRVEALQQVWSECLPIELQLAPAVCIRSGSRARERSARRHVAAAAADGRGGGISANTRKITFPIRRGRPDEDTTWPTHVRRRVTFGRFEMENGRDRDRGRGEGARVSRAPCTQTNSVAKQNGVRVD